MIQTSSRELHSASGTEVPMLGGARSRVRDRLFMHLFSRTFVFNILFEDSDVDRRYLDLPDDARILTVAGGGCGAAALAAFSPASLDIVDINLAQVSLAALKTLAPRYLTYDDFYTLLGIGRSSRAADMIATVMRDEQVPDSVRQYWTRRSGIFSRGLYRSGLSSHMTRRLAMLCGLDREWIADVAVRPEEERVRRVQQDVCRVLSRPVIRQITASPLHQLGLGINFRQKERIERVEQVSFFDHILGYLQDVCRTDMMRNWFIWNALIGEFNHGDPAAVPTFLRPDTYRDSVRRQTRVQFHHRNLVDVLQSRPDDYWTCVNCSDCLDWLSVDDQRAVLNWVYRKTAPGGRVLVRSVDPIDPVRTLGLQAKLKLRRSVSEQAAREDRSRLYRSVSFYDVEK